MRWILLLIAAVLFALPYEFCMDGTGWGFPWAWLHPDHGAPDEIALGPGHFGLAFDPANLGWSMVGWSVSCGLALLVRWRWQRRRPTQPRG